MASGKRDGCDGYRPSHHQGGNQYGLVAIDTPAEPPGELESETRQANQQRDGEQNPATQQCCFEMQLKVLPCLGPVTHRYHPRGFSPLAMAKSSAAETSTRIPINKKMADPARLSRPLVE